jgi:hypothetical protein
VRLALRWLVCVKLETPLDPALETNLNVILDEMEKYRKKYFGDLW